MEMLASKVAQKKSVKSKFNDEFENYLKTQCLKTTFNGVELETFSWYKKVLGLAYKLYLTNREGFGDAGNAIYSSGFQIYALLLTFSSTGVPNAIAKPLNITQKMPI